MLTVSDYIEVARESSLAEQLIENVAGRFDRSEQRAPVIVWNVCRHCNMSCPHCYAAATEKPSRQTLSTEEGLDLIEQMAACGIRVLIFSGGEPLMREDLFELIERAYDLGMSTHLSTNGVLINTDVARRLEAAGIGYVGVSIDGLEAFNDSYRGLVGGYRRAIEGLKNARRAGMKTGLRITLTQKNLDQLAPLIERARQIPVDRFYVSHLLYAGRAAAMQRADLSPEKTRETLLWLFDTADELLGEPDAPRFVTGGNDSDGALLLRWLHERYGEEAARTVRRMLELRGGNSAGEGILNVDHLGRVHPDQFWRQETLGSIKAHRFAEILAHPLRKQLRERRSKLRGRCQSCRWVDLCRGSHRERALARFGDRWGPDPACVMTDAEVAFGLDAPTPLTSLEEGHA